MPPSLFVWQIFLRVFSFFLMPLSVIFASAIILTSPISIFPVSVFPFPLLQLYGLLPVTSISSVFLPPIFISFQPIQPAASRIPTIV